jgi:hypothetical protein
MAYLFFEETQRFRQTWLWLLIGATCLLAIIVPVVSSDIPVKSGDMLIFMITPLLVVLMFFILRLNTRIDKDGIWFRFVPFHFKEKFISWKDVEKAEVVKYSPLAEYGGWGIKYGRKGRAYNVSGNMGLFITLKNKKTIMIGTRKPEEMSEVVKGIFAAGKNYE